jgi:hypothetical protein
MPQHITLEEAEQLHKIYGLVFIPDGDRHRIIVDEEDDIEPVIIPYQ